MNLSDAVLTDHAKAQMDKREITEADVRRVLSQPESIHDVQAGRIVAQAMIGEYLVRVFVDVDRDPPELVTAYRTSQVSKYRTQP